MKNKFSLFLLIFVMNSLNLTAQMNKSQLQLQNIFLDILSDEGIEGKIDSDGDVRFEYNDNNYFIGVNEDDQEFVRVVLANIWPIESESERLEVLRAVDIVNAGTKVAKAHTFLDNVWISVELFLQTPRDLASVLLRSLSSIESATNSFVEEM